MQRMYTADPIRAHNSSIHTLPDRRMQEDVFLAQRIIILQIVQGIVPHI